MSNLNYYTKLDYKTSYDCDQYGCNDICRCGSIKNEKVVDVDLNKLINFIIDEVRPSKRSEKISNILDLSDPDKYCVSRVLSILKFWDYGSYEIEIDSGYYGENITGVYHNSYDGVIDHCSKILSMNSINEKIRYVLNLEYGFVNFNSKDFVLTNIDINSIDKRSINKNHRKSVIKKRISYYINDYYLPKGIVRRIGDGYSIIDGYHRIFSSKQKKINVYQLI